ncbi:exonuclease subunit SbcD [Bifidobacterium callimiconis]|uniref:exonuclease subunit SbcD n=1 Tax=Bifidobacterium callimiconis TaxID=2306973 RepID=UPI001BDBCA1C|nr:exonuclease SbcCD subunit D C-terminal domain-containing protein [Bifidobacterium callimiconis]MBT1177868.1 exonuclease subunit SbcD [Bifidobacterium callimiconis]
MTNLELMRILHTSDWHIGRRFKGLDLAEYQRRALDWLVDTVRREHVDVVCVSGDVYDSPMPSAASVDLLDDVLTRLTSLEDDEGRPAVDVIVTPGNHDSARKLGFGSRMMRPNLHLCCDIARIAEPVIVTRGGDATGERLAVYALPYLDPDVARPVLEKLLAEASEPALGEQTAGEQTISKQPWDEQASAANAAADFSVKRAPEGDNDGNSGDNLETLAKSGGSDTVHNARNSGDNGLKSEYRSTDSHAASNTALADRPTAERPESDPSPTSASRIPRSHEGVMTAAMRLIRADLQRRRAEAKADGVPFHAVLMAHAFVSGASPSDSERNLTIGGVDSVPAAVFSDSGLDYLALGHLHRAQQVRIPASAGVAADVSSDTTTDVPADEAAGVPAGASAGVVAPMPPIARYAGSLLAYSFSESCTPPTVGSGKSVAIVDLPADSVASHSGDPAVPDSPADPAALRSVVTGASADSTPTDSDLADLVASHSGDPGITAGIGNPNDPDDPAGTGNPNGPNGSDTHIAVRTIPVESGQPALVQLKGSPDELLGALATEYRHDWVSLTVVADAYPHGMYQKLDVAYDNALEKNFEITRRADHGSINGNDRTMANLRETHSEIDVLEGFVRYTLGRDPNDSELAVLRDAVERVHAAGAGTKDDAKGRGNVAARNEKGVRA